MKHHQPHKETVMKRSEVLGNEETTPPIRMTDCLPPVVVVAPMFHIAVENWNGLLPSNQMWEGISQKHAFKWDGC